MPESVKFLIVAHRIYIDTLVIPFENSLIAQCRTADNATSHATLVLPRGHQKNAFSEPNPKVISQRRSHDVIRNYFSQQTLHRDLD